LQTLVASAGRHPNVGDHHVRTLALDGVEQRREIAADRHYLELGLRLEQAADALADEVMVVGENDADSHDRRSIRPSGITVVAPWTLLAGRVTIADGRH
jgi:hypothetical protein